MFVTLKEFYDNFKIRNGDKPNETVFNRPLFRLKREIRELKSVLGILTGVELEVWNPSKYYERDEYVIYNSSFYRSLFDGNVGNDPTLLTAWVEETPVQFYTKPEIDMMLANIAGSSKIHSPYRLVTVDNDYTPTPEDFDGNTIIRVNTKLPSANINIVALL